MLHILEIISLSLSLFGTLLLAISSILGKITDNKIYKALKPESRDTEVHSYEQVKRIKNEMRLQNYMSIIGFTSLFIATCIILAHKIRTG